MTKTSKTLVIIGIIIIWLVLSLLNINSSEANGHKTPGMLGIILLVGMIAAVRAVWKYEPENKSSNEIDKHHLDKK